HQARNSSRRGNKIPFRRRIDSSKPTCRQNRCCKNGSDHRFRFPSGPLLEQETGLNPTEIMTDTAGASELVFGLFWLLGYQFSPRLADA
ncbi:Tn3 family transposase, partial [Citrobacter sedlakii]